LDAASLEQYQRLAGGTVDIVHSAVDNAFALKDKANVDVAVVLGGDTRLAFHGVDRILPGTSTLLPEGGRINLTMRRVTSFDVDFVAPAGSSTGSA
jgi:hypothetical protein